MAAHRRGGVLWAALLSGLAFNAYIVRTRGFQSLPVYKKDGEQLFLMSNDCGEFQIDTVAKASCDGSIGIKKESGWLINGKSAPDFKVRPETKEDFQKVALMSQGQLDSIVKADMEKFEQQSSVSTFRGRMDEDDEVLEVDDLPANTFLSLRYGDTRKQAPFRAGETFAFAPNGAKQPKAFTVDVFQKVASSQVSLAGISALGGSLTNVEIETLDIGCAPLKASFEASLRSFDQEEKPGISRGRNAAERAKQYMEQSGVQQFLQEMFTQLLERKPEDYLGFLADFIEQKQEEADHAELQNDIDFSSEPGLGEDALPGFAAFPLPDISKHNSIATEVLQAQPELEQLANLRTSTGVSLAQCIKPAVDCPGHPMVKVAGAFAGDAECYSLFQQFFDPLVAALSCGTICNGAPQPSDGDVSKISGAQIDPTGSYVVYTVLEARRNVAGIRMPVCCSREERREVERLLSSARLRGTYLPLRGSKSGKGMAAYQEERLRKVGMLLTEPDSKLKLAAGFGRHWPDARGVFVCDAPGVFIWCNEEDHYRFFARQEGSELKELYERLARAVSSVAEAAASAKQEFAASKLGWLTTCPSRVGAALRVTLTLRIPLLAKAVDLPALCERLHLRCDSSSSAISGNLWQVHSLSSLGVSEVELMNEVIQGCRLLVGLEQRLEQNTCIDSIEALPEVADLAGYPSHFALESYVTRFLLQGQGMVVSPKLFSALFEVRGSKSTPNKKSRFLPHLSPVGTLSPRSR
ncbi:CKMT2 [Symbiodinium natans]|uniref:CKMT2 protein n=1 Tax=Symbiodinium natans TaxID=878477 RepID=A0A812GAE5_9DINO|nr:CKMT2 [Symbiodinium natans]